MLRHLDSIGWCRLNCVPGKDSSTASYFSNEDGRVLVQSPSNDCWVTFGYRWKMLSSFSVVLWLEGWECATIVSFPTTYSAVRAERYSMYPTCHAPFWLSAFWIVVSPSFLSLQCLSSECVYLFPGSGQAFFVVVCRTLESHLSKHAGTKGVG